MGFLAFLDLKEQMSAREVLNDVLGSRVSDLSDILDYLVSILEDTTLDEEEVVETVAPMIEGAVGDGEAEVLSKKLFGRLRAEQAAVAKEWVKQKDDVSLVDKDALAAMEAKKKERMEKRARREEVKYRKKMEKKGVQTVGFMRSTSLVGGTKDIRVENFTITFGRAQLLVDANLLIAQGRKYGLVGRNGSGKSTLLRHISSRELAIQKNISILHVEQEVEGDDTRELDSVISADLELIQLWDEEKTLLAKDPESVRLPFVYKRLAEIEADTAEARAASILAGLSFTPDMQVRPTKEFSGGWRMRIALARALFCRPDLLLLDEPTNHLDFHAIVWLENFLVDWAGTLLIVSHQREFLNSVCTDVMHLTQKQLFAYRGNYDDFERAANEKMKHMQKAFEAQEKQKLHIKKFIDRFRVNANRAALVQSRIKRLEKMAELNPVVEEGAVRLPFFDPEPVSPPILQLEDVSFGYEGQPLLFKNVNLGVDLESRVALVGRNGSGKSTLLYLFTGQLAPNSGNIYLNNRIRFATFSQHFVDQLDLNVSPLEYFTRLYPKVSSQELRSHLGKYGIIGDIALRSMRTLSGGQKSRVVFAHIAYQRPHMLVLDEPSNHLDIETIEGLAQSLSVFQGGVLMVTHDQRLIELVCDEIWNLEDNEVTKWPGEMADYKKYLLSQLSP